MANDPWRTVPVLSGRHVRLEPLRAEHAAPLARAAEDGDLPALNFTFVPGAGEAEAYVAQALAMQAAGTALPFVVMDAEGAIIGSTRFYELDPAVPRLAIGYTWYAARAQRTGVNTECKRLLLAHAFEALGCVAVALETSHLNTRSQAAIERLGATLDGVLRAHFRHRDGSLRDSHVYSILAGEWPGIRARLDARLEQGA